MSTKVQQDLKAIYTPKQLTYNLLRQNLVQDQQINKIQSEID